MTDLWGISGPRFLEIYLGSLIAPAVAGLLRRQWRIRRVEPAGPRRSGMTLHHLAYLAGGAKRAAEPAAVGRRAAVADAGDER